MMMPGCDLGRWKMEDSGIFNQHQNGDAEPMEDSSHICRDFLRNVCRRGRWCKFLHPANASELPPDVVSSQEPARPELTFCHDYQNKMCARSNCKFVHCTREEEEFFRATGELPTHVMEAAIRKGLAPDLPLGRGEVPFCKDYLKGHCARGTKCKFRHVSSSELELELLRLRARRRELDHREAVAAASMEPMLAPPEPKRRHCEEPIMALQVANTSTALGVGALVLGLAQQATGQPTMTLTQPQPQGQAAPQPQIGLQVAHPVEMHLVDDENLMLRQKIEELKKQVSDLTATNEFLLDQNAQLRLMSKQSTNVTTVSLPTVTITNTVPVSAVSTVHVTPLVTPISQPLSVTRVATAGPPPPTAATAQSTAPTVAVPVSIAAAVPLTQLSSPATVSIAQAPSALTAVAVSIAQSRAPSLAAVSITQPPSAPQQQAQAAPPQSLTIPLSISGATAPLVTYPIITQTPALRPQQ